MENPKPILVSVKEACRLLSLCRSTLEKYMATEIKSRKVGKKRLVVMASLESFAKRDHVN